MLCCPLSNMAKLDKKTSMSCQCCARMCLEGTQVCVLTSCHCPALTFFAPRCGSLPLSSRSVLYAAVELLLPRNWSSKLPQIRSAQEKAMLFPQRAKINESLIKQTPMKFCGSSPTFIVDGLRVQIHLAVITCIIRHNPHNPHPRHFFSSSSPPFCSVHSYYLILSHTISYSFSSFSWLCDAMCDAMWCSVTSCTQLGSCMSWWVVATRHPCWLRIKGLLYTVPICTNRLDWYSSPIDSC